MERRTRAHRVLVPTRKREQDVALVALMHGFRDVHREGRFMSATLYEYPLHRIDGTPATLADYRGQVLLVVNVASKCGLTPQYAGLQSLYETYRDRGLVVAGFPANEFGAQEPGSNDEIATFCETSFGVTFPMFQKIVVKGAGIDPLYSELIRTPPGGDIQWNFEKFLVDREGNVTRFAPTVTPSDPALVAAIENALGPA
jgi:glutathione peroxidase